MLKSVDVLIGLVVVLLALSMAVTVITQSLTTVINSRGRHLRRGLTDLLRQLDPKLTETVSRAVADRVLTHPLVCGSSSPVGGRRLGNVIHREEFTKLLMHVATEDEAGLEAQAKATLESALKANGIGDPKARLRDIRMAALHLEQLNPELAHGARQNLAILQQADSEFVAKINNWFDQTMDRTSQRFTASTRAITFVGAFIVAFGLQVDTLALVNRLAADDKLRETLVNEAIEADKERASQSNQQQDGTTAQPSQPNAKTPEEAAPAPDGGKPAATEGSGDTATATAAEAEAAKTAADSARIQRYRSLLSDYGIITLPSAEGWKKSFEKANYFGLLITALLLSLGAPFWYKALGGLLQLRSVLAVKDDAQRESRQSNDTSGGASAAPPSRGERGDVLAVG